MSRSTEELIKENDRLRLELSNAKVEIAKSQQMITSLMIKLETLNRDYEKAVLGNGGQSTHVPSNQPSYEQLQNDLNEKILLLNEWMACGNELNRLHLSLEG